MGCFTGNSAVCIAVQRRPGVVYVVRRKESFRAEGGQFENNKNWYFLFSSYFDYLSYMKTSSDST